MKSIYSISPYTNIYVSKFPLNALPSQKISAKIKQEGGGKRKDGERRRERGGGEERRYVIILEISQK